MVGIKEKYPRISRYNKKLSAYIQLMRPFTLISPIVAGIIGTSLPLIYNYKPILHYWAELIYVAVTLALAQVIGQITNQTQDVEIDKIAKPYRPIPRGDVTKDEAMGIAWVLAIFAVARGFTVSITFGLFICLILFFAITFNIEPIRSKRYCWLGISYMSVSRGLLPFLATWSIFGNLSELLPWILGIFAFLWVFALNPTKDFADFEADKKFGIMTLPVKYGINKAVKMMKVLSVFPFIYLTLVFYMHLLPYSFLLLYSLIPFVILAWWGLNKVWITENNLSWCSFYLGLASVYILSLIALW
jgi:4-hydroxybenzoate polyprenyltransferase